MKRSYIIPKGRVDIEEMEVEMMKIMMSCFLYGHFPHTVF